VFDSRATATEFLDRPDCDPALAAASYRFMEMVNRRFGGIRMVRRFLATEGARRHVGGPLRVLDIGSGSCDIPLAVSRWARAHDIPLHVTCLEIAGHTVDIAQEQLTRAGNPAVQLLQEDVFTHQPAEPYDCAVASMCFHHFSDALRRSGLAYLAARLLLVGTPPGVRHDALLSIRRGFQISELSALLRQLGNVTVSVESARWFRIAAIVRFKPGDDL
jgi:hypothetical protein